MTYIYPQYKLQITRQHVEGMSKVNIEAVSKLNQVMNYFATTTLDYKSDIYSVAPTIAININMKSRNSLLKGLSLARYVQCNSYDN